MRRDRILVVDDEDHIRRAVGRALTARGYSVEEANDGETAIAATAAFEPDLVILDLNMLGMDGLDVTRYIRQTSAVPILVLSVREEPSDKVGALDLGADDYLTKPFSVDEMMARVRALLRRAAPQGAGGGTRFSSDGVDIDLVEHTVSRDGQDVRLTKTEWALLEALARHPAKLLTHQWLLENVWGAGYADDVEVLRVFVSQLRRKIEVDPGRPRVIGTDPGIGYRWLLRPADVPADRRT